METKNSWPRAWIIELSLKILATRSSWQNVFHFTSGENAQRYPILYIKGGTTALYCEYKIWTLDHPKSDNDVILPLNEFTKIRIENKYIDPFTYKFEIHQKGTFYIPKSVNKGF